MIRHILLREFGSAIAVTLSPDEVSAISKASSSWKKALGLPDLPIVIEFHASGTYIRAQHVAGTIRVGEINVEIAPKFLDPESDSGQEWRQAFWRILMVTQTGRSVFGESTGTEGELSVADLLGELFLRSFSSGSMRGMPLEYHESREISPTPKGSFDVTRYAEWAVRPWLVPTVLDVLDDNTPLARLLGWASAQLRSVVSSPARARALSLVAIQLRGAGNVPGLDQAERIRLGVQHAGLADALRVAILLLRGHGVEHGRGATDVIGFLWKTSDVYERFIFWLCNQSAARLSLSVAKRAAIFGVSDEFAPLVTTPDVVFFRQDGTVASVLDAKYKKLNSTPKAADSYQVLTAANTLGCARVGLIYPSNMPRAERSWLVKSELGGSDIRIFALSIDPCWASSQIGVDQLVEVISDWLSSLGLDAPDLDTKISTASPSYV